MKKLNLKKFLPRIALASYLVLFGYAGFKKAPKDWDYFFNPPPKLVQTEKLAVNFFPKIRTIVKKNEEQGIKDLQQLVMDSESEEAFAYLPKKELWVEIGVANSVSKEGAVSIDKVYVDMLAVYSLMKQNKHLVLYHLTRH